MRRSAVCALLTVLCSQVLIGRDPSVAAAAAKYVSGVTWRANSVVSADFACSGKVGSAILGTSSSEIVIAVFLRGASSPPEILRYSARVRNPATARLGIEGLDYDPEKDPGYPLPGFQRSKRCKGLNLSDGDTDSAHIYWNHIYMRFEDWGR